MIGPYRPSKRIVYLDQNFISNIAKPSSTPDPAVNVKIREKLLRLLKGDAIACPTSEFHTRETLYSGDEQLRRAIQEVIREVCHGLGFRQYFDILEVQTRRALYEYTGNELVPAIPEWSEAFVSDPDTVTDGNHYCRQPVYVEMSPFFEAGLAAKRSYPERALRAAKTTRERGVAFDERLAELQTWFARIAFGPLIELLLAQAKAAAGQPLDEIALFPSYASRVYENFCELSGSEELPKFAEFLKSPQFKHTPFVRIFCSIHAAMEVNSTKPEAGDYDDSEILATVLPYCDIVATDNNKKRLLEELGFDAEFTVTLFSAKQEDLSALIEFLGAL